jgi:hypothetical protein
MANKALEQQVRSFCDEFANSLALTIRRSVLEQVVAAMGGGAPARRGPGRPRGSGSKRSAEQVDAMGEKLLAHVKSNPGQRADQIAKTLRSDVHTIRRPMQQLLAAKKVKTKGQRRGMTYYSA